MKKLNFYSFLSQIYKIYSVIALLMCFVFFYKKFETYEVKLTLLACLQTQLPSFYQLGTDKS